MYALNTAFQSLCSQDLCSPPQASFSPNTLLKPFPNLVKPHPQQTGAGSEKPKMVNYPFYFRDQIKAGRARTLLSHIPFYLPRQLFKQEVRWAGHSENKMLQLLKIRLQLFYRRAEGCCWIVEKLNLYIPISNTGLEHHLLQEQ